MTNDSDLETGFRFSAAWRFVSVTPAVREKRWPNRVGLNSPRNVLWIKKKLATLLYSNPMILYGREIDSRSLTKDMTMDMTMEMTMDMTMTIYSKRTASSIA